MFFTQIIDSHTAKIQWQHNCHRNTALVEGIIRVQDPKNLINKINKNKAAWLRRTLEEYLTNASLTLICEAQLPPFEWPRDASTPKVKFDVANAPREWRERWHKRILLRTMLTKFIKEECSLQNMVRELHARKADILLLSPNRPGLRTTDLKALADELCTWIDSELISISDTASVWTH